MDDTPKRRGRRPTEQPTEAQLRVLRAIKDGIVQRGFPPTAKELGSRLGVAPATAHEQVNQLVKKGFLHREPNKARGLSIMCEPQEQPIDLVAVPLLGTVAAGPALLAEENVLGEVMVERRMVASGPHFALRITGDSMRDAAINDGDIVIVRQQPVAQHNDIVVAMLDTDATVKRLYIREHEIELRPANPDYEPIAINPDDDRDISLLCQVPGLTYLDLCAVEVSQANADRLRKCHPSCRIRSASGDGPDGRRRLPSEDR